MARPDKKNGHHAASEISAVGIPTKEMGSIGSDILNREQLEMIQWLKKVRFRKQLFGGISEEDVWKKIEQLNELYDAALRAERIRYDVLLKERLNNTEPLPQAAETHKGNTADE